MARVVLGEEGGAMATIFTQRGKMLQQAKGKGKREITHPQQVNGIST